MSLISKLSGYNTKSATRPIPSYKLEEVGALLHCEEFKEETSKRNGHIIHKFKLRMAFVTKNWHVFSVNFTLKIDTVDEQFSILAPKVYSNQNAEDLTTKPNPVNSTVWRTMYKSYQYWNFYKTGAGQWLSGKVSYDFGRGVKEQLPIIVAELLTLGKVNERPTSDRGFTQEIADLVTGVVSNDEPFIPFDPVTGIEIYALEYDPTDASNEEAKPAEPELLSYPRGNGKNYYARTIMNHVDVELLRTFRNAGLYCRLEGLPGCGKTALAEASFGDQLLTANGNSSYDPNTFVGMWTPNLERTPENPGEYVWTDGVLCQAMKEGRPLFIDEATLLPASALDIIRSATDGRGYIDLVEYTNKPRIYAKEGFYVFMAYNPDPMTGNDLPDAIRSRFGITIDVKTDFTSLKHFDIPTNAVRVATRLNMLHTENVERGGRGIWVPQMRELLGFKQIVDSGLNEEFAFNNWVGLCPEIFRDNVLKAIKEVTRQNAKALSLGGLVELNGDSGDNTKDVLGVHGDLLLDESYTFDSNSSEDLVKV